MKNLSLLLCCVITMLSCKKDITPEIPMLTVLSPNGGEKFEAGQTITVRWNSANLSSETLIAAQIVNTVTNKPTVGVFLHPTHSVSSSMGDVTANDGEETYQIPWRYDQDGRMLYDGLIGSNTFTIQINAGSVDALGMWNIGSEIIEGKSKKPFTVVASQLPDGCLSTAGYSVTTGQPCQ